MYKDTKKEIENLNEAVNNGTATNEMRQEVIDAKIATAKATSLLKKEEDAYEMFAGSKSMKSKYEESAKSSDSSRIFEIALEIDKKRQETEPVPGVKSNKTYDTPNFTGQLGTEYIGDSVSIDAIGNNLFESTTDSQKHPRDYNPYKNYTPRVPLTMPTEFIENLFEPVVDESYEDGTGGKHM